MKSRYNFNQLRDMLDSNDPLIALADRIDWNIFEVCQPLSVAFAIVAECGL